MCTREVVVSSAMMMHIVDNFVDRTLSRTETARSNANNTRRIEDWHNKEFGIVWNMDVFLKKDSIGIV